MVTDDLERGASLAGTGCGVEGDEAAVAWGPAPIMSLRAPAAGLRRLTAPSKPDISALSPTKLGDHEAPSVGTRSRCAHDPSVLVFRHPTIQSSAWQPDGV